MSGYQTKRAQENMSFLFSAHKKKIAPIPAVTFRSAEFNILVMRQGDQRVAQLLAPFLGKACCHRIR